jgi:hypothetical protein
VTGLPRIQIEPIPAWHWPVAGRPKGNPFAASYADTVEVLRGELRALGCRDFAVLQVVCAVSDVRADGLLRTRARPIYQGVALSFDSVFGPLTYPCDTYAGSARMPGWQANVRAVALGLRALRAVDRYGIAGRGEQYRGFRAIGSGGQVAEVFATAAEAEVWLREMTGSVEPQSVESALRIGARLLHPDTTGGRFDAVVWARYESARRVLTASRAKGGAV